MGMVRAHVCQNWCVQCAFPSPLQATRCESSVEKQLNVKINVSMRPDCLTQEGVKPKVAHKHLTIECPKMCSK